MSRAGLALAGAYLLLAALAVGYTFYKLTSDVANSELSGVPLIVVGLPWSLLVIELVQVVRPRLEGLGPLLAMTVPGVLLNAWLTYLLGRGAGSTAARRDSMGPP